MSGHAEYGTLVSYNKLDKFPCGRCGVDYRDHANISYINHRWVYPGEQNRRQGKTVEKRKILSDMKGSE